VISYKIYYINLDKDKKRKSFIEDRFKNLNHSITRIPAVNGYELEDEIIRQADKDQSFIMSIHKPSAGQIGCFLSHRNAWNIIQKQKEDFALLLEDDALLDESFFSDIQEILKSISINDFVDISSNQGKIKLKETNLLIKYITPPHGTLGQIIGKNGAKKLFDNISYYWTAVDNMQRYIYKHKVEIYSTKKAYAIEKGDSLGGSTIDTNHTNKRTIKMKFIRIFWRILHTSMKLKILFLNYRFYKSNEPIKV